MNVTKELRSLRKLRGMTIEELAAASGSSTKTISKVENQRQDATITLMNRLLSPLGYELTISKKPL